MTKSMIPHEYREILLQALATAVPDMLRSQDDTGRFGDAPWVCNDQHAIYSLAAAWAVDDAANPYHHSPQLLEAIMAGGDVLIEEADEEGRWTFRKKDHSTWGQVFMCWTYSRWARTFSLIRDAMPAERRARWEAALKRGYEGIVRSNCLTYMHNTTTHDAMGLYCAGQLFGREDWMTQARDFMARAVAAQTPDGWWSEHAGPVVMYNYTYSDAMGVYYAMSRDATVLEALRRAAVFHTTFTYPNGAMVETIDERNSYLPGIPPGNVGFSFSPEGRRYLLQQARRCLRRGKEIEADFAATMLLYGNGAEPELTADEETPARLTLGDGHALTDRTGPWFACLSAFTAAPPQDRWIQDRQNYLSLYHDRLGVFLGGGNTKLQPLWSTFTVGDVTLLAHKPGDEEPDFVPDIDLRWCADSAHLLTDGDELGLDLSYGTEACTLRLVMRDDVSAIIAVASACRTGKWVEAHLPLLRRGAEVSAASGLRAALDAEGFTWTAEQAGGSIQHAGLAVTMPPGSRLVWPALPHNPYAKDGRCGHADGRLVLAIPLDHAPYSAQVEFTVIGLKDAFLQNRERYLSVLGDDLGYMPPTEWSRKAGFGEIIRPCTDMETERFANTRPPATQAGIATLAAAYRDTRDESYAEKAKAYYLTWISEHPAGDPDADTRRNEGAAHGLYGWLGTLHLLLPSPAFDDETVQAIIGEAREQLEYLYNNLWSEHNWINLRCTYATSLLCNGLRLAFLPEAARWIARGAHVMSDASHRQIHPDGSHMEATPHYHFCAAGDILNAFRKARLLPELGMNMDAEKVAKLFDYLTAATHPTGWVTSMHDGDYGDPSAVRGNGIADAIEERAAFRASLGLPEAPLPVAQVFPDAGQAFLRDRWTDDATYLTFDATRFGGYHQHPSRNAIQLQAFGRMLLIDPGRFSYQNRPWNVYGASTRAHSTMNVNGWNQQSRSTPSLRHRSAPGYDLMEGLYNGGYWEHESVVDWEWENESAAGIFAEHHRLLLWVRDRCVVVIDDLFCPHQAGPRPRLECVWQLSQGTVILDAERGRACTGHPDANLLMLFPLQPEGMTLSVHEGETDPLRGWVPRTFDQEFIPAPQVVQSVESYASRHADLVTVLIPFRGTEAPQVEAIALADPEKTTGDFFHPGYGRVQLRWADGSTDDIWWKRRLEIALDEQDGFITDGSLVHLQKDAAGCLERGLVVDGTYIAPYRPVKNTRMETFRV